MRAIVNGKLYDTEKSEHIYSLYKYDVYRTQRGNVFAVDWLNEIVIDREQLGRNIEGIPGLTNAYIEIFGMPEEA